MTSWRRRGLAGAASVLILLLGLAGCGADDTGSDVEEPPTPPEQIVDTEDPADPPPVAPAPEEDPAPPPIAPPPADEAEPAADPEGAVEPEPVVDPEGADPSGGTPVEVEANPPANAEQEPVELPFLATEEPELAPEMLAMIEAGDIVAGRTYATRCTACHALDPGGLAPAAAQIAPSLYGMFGARIAAVPGFDYSPAFQAVYDANVDWTAARLDLFLQDPVEAIPGTAMSAGAISDPVDRANLIAFIRSLAIAPLPIAGEEAPAAVEGNPELLAMIAEADLERGQTLAARCSGCHRYAEGEEGLIGPNLYDIVGKLIGARGGFIYSPALAALNEAGEIWTYDRLDAFLEAPAAAIPGTRMGFGGVGDIRDRAAIIAYLRGLAAAPYPLNVETADDGVGVVREGLLPVTFTEEQAAAGEADYTRWCADCHAQNLRGEVDLRLGEGVGVAPPLVGPNFEHRWFADTIGLLFDHVERREPNDAPGTLDAATYANVLAYILERNGFRSGTVELPIDNAALGEMGFFQE